jgi:predicted dehydrogenase/threonine dehydrogenase-like Zn-dependent dehydrogenase
MKQIFQQIKSGTVQLSDIPSPIVEPGKVLVRNYFSAISPGTERASIELGKKSLLSKAKSRPDLVREVLHKVKSEGIISAYNKVSQKLDDFVALGYSSAGVVIGVGEGVEGFLVGDEVACAGQNYASHAEVVNVPKNLCSKLPKGVSLKEASFVALGSVALWGIRRTGLTQGEKVAVIGLGLLGQMTVKMLKAYGFPVIGLDIDAKKVSLALAEGMDKGGVINQDDIQKLVDEFTHGLGVDAVIVTAASKDNGPIELAGEITRDRGRVCAVGDFNLEIPRRTYFKKEIDFFISRSYGPGRYDVSYEEKGQDYPLGYVRWTEKRNMEEFLRLLQEKKLEITSLVTQEFSIEEASHAYEFLMDNQRKEQVLGMVFSYTVDKRQEDIIWEKKERSSRKQGSINLGLIGLGNFTQGVLLPIIQKIQNTNIYCVADVDGMKTSKVISKYGGDYATTDYHKVIKDNNVDVIIAAPRHDVHAKMVVEALEHNKNVYVEKPLALNEKELEEVMTSAKTSSGRLMVGFNRRFSSLVKAAKDFFKGEDFPLLMNYRVNAGKIPADHWVHDAKQGGGRIIGEVCHFVDTLQYICGARPIKVYATMVPQSGQIKTLDNVIVVIDFENGSRGTILYNSLGNNSVLKEWIEVFGADKAVQIDDFKSAHMFHKQSRKTMKKFSQDKGHSQEMAAFLNSVLLGQASPISLDEIFSSTKTSFAILESLKQGKPIDIG